MGEDLRLRQGGMPPEHSAILPLKQNSESFLDRGNGSQATHILDLTQTTHELMASVLSKLHTIFLLQIRGRDETFEEMIPLLQPLLLHSLSPSLSLCPPLPPLPLPFPLPCLPFPSLSPPVPP